METAFYIFKDHPNIKGMKFVVEPMIREKIMIGSDMPSFNSYQTVVQEYKKMFEEVGATLDLQKMDQFS